MSNKYLFSTLLACFLLQVGLQNIQAQDYPASPLEKEGYRLIFTMSLKGKRSTGRNGFLSICLLGRKTGLSVHRRMR